MITFPEADLRLTRNRARWFACEWFSEVPIRIHAPHEIDDDGSPAFHRDFIDYIDEGLRQKREPRHMSDSPKLRAKRAFRRLRAKAPREFDAAFLMVTVDQMGRDVRPDDEEALKQRFEASLRATTHRLNQRARARGERPYAPEDVLVLLVSAFHKLSLWAG